MTTHTQIAQPTPTPWTQRGEEVVTNKPMLGAYNEESVLSTSRPPQERIANAAYIVRACNAHQALVEALEDVQLALLARADDLADSESDQLLPIVAAALRLAKGEK